MTFVSTRGECDPVSFSEAVRLGLAPDGGLFVPEELPDLRARLEAWSGLGFVELCREFLSLFADDLPRERLETIVRRSYERFDHPEIAPLRRLDDRRYILELFHGPTMAFKDIALQLLGNVYEEQCRKRGEGINVLGATSGDTGAAAIHGLLGKGSTRIFILYPDGRVSPLQERQMTCTGADNVFAIAVRGSFDDAQAIVKELFGDAELRRDRRLSAINSINLARILAQSVYYLHAWFRLPPESRADTLFVVPTGNFGNVFSGWLVREMGVPIHGFRIATNRNDILYRLFTDGDYTVGELHPSLAPSMDIQVASNFERYLYYAEGRDPARVRGIMESFRKNRGHRFDSFARGPFSVSRADDDEIRRIIGDVASRHDCVVDPHTACGFKDLPDDRPVVILSTAHPAKFPEAIREATGREPTHPRLEELKGRPVVKHRLPADAKAVRAFIEANGL